MRSERIRVGYVIPQLAHGGAERQLYELSRGLDATRFQCVVYCLSERTFPYGDMIREAGIELRILKPCGHFDISRVLQLARLVRKDRIDILHAFLFHANGYAWPARWLAGGPRLVTSARNCQTIGWLRDRVNRLAFQGSDAIVCNGEAVRSFIGQHYRVPAEKCAVIYNGVDLERFALSTESPPSAYRSGDGLVITVGRLVPQKDIELFLDAAALLTHRQAGTRFVIVGDGHCRGALERYAAHNGLGRQVAFLGERADVPELLRTADVVWLTSAWEGLSNVLLEAMACAKPIVTRDVGACREIVRHGVNGYLVPKRDAEAFAHYTLGLLTNPVQASEMGQAGRKIAEEKFSLSAMIRNTVKLYDSLLDSRVGVAG
ncbi:Glycosyltransferase, group 1 family protein [Candidatus Methylomirabilis lanthanidiphila]|uniref:Glycosyltransferase, group 1 family protein n=1 Tax=Candidatus Methylomirabilis lanthanidiphila TaxID=2211376 RepID=A0A564ZL16_9BACT|nr:glycosyltransferase [Candidatus Methylomirabilis lanthanidiphila]VUZ86021.1 Glycosyltransferase, group 1 family protein [Candidatus Methylomirabilis lanthanidiphila]